MMALKIFKMDHVTKITPFWGSLSSEANTWLEGTILGYKKLELRTLCASIILLIGLLTFETVYLTMLSCLIQLTRLNPGLINFGNIKMLFVILKPKFMEPEVGVVIRY